MDADENDPGRGLRTIGVCAVCDRGAKLVHRGICACCVVVYGPRFGPALGRARTERAFALACWEAIRPHQRRLFLALVGDPQTDAWPVRRHECGDVDLKGSVVVLTARRAQA